MTVKTVTDESFAADVLESTMPVLVDFWAEWCAPCRLLIPVLDELSSAYGDRMVVAKVNIDENTLVREEQGVVSLPTMHVYHEGRLVKVISGLRTMKGLLRELATTIQVEV